MIIHMLITWLSIIARPIQPYEVPPPNDIFHVAEGMWGWSTTPHACTKAPQRLTFTPDHSMMVIEWADDSGQVKAARYQLRYVSASTIRGFITDETRKTPTGELVVWDLVLTSPDTYRWHRTDWAPGGYTGEVFRCPAGTRLPIRAK
jgi:hypothetical protein